MSLHWEGEGIAVPVVSFASLLGTQFAVNRYMEDEQYYQAHGWPKLLALWMAAIVLYFLVKDARRRNPKASMMADTFFLIPMRAWPGILLALGVVSLCW